MSLIFGSSTTHRSLVQLALVFMVVACGDITGVAPERKRLPVDGTATQDVFAAAVTYYVSPTGNDHNAGTSPAKAWKTIAKVNAKTFSPGDRVLFQGGSVFGGALSFTAAEKGNAAAPIVIGSYGSGRATINGGNGSAITLYNTSGYAIRNINVVGSGRTTNTGSGVNVFADLAGGVKLTYIRIDSVDASGFGKYGIVVGSWNNSTGFADVRVTYASAHDNAHAGMSTYAQLPYAHQGFYFGHLVAYNNTGVAGLTVNSGSGIVMGGVTGGVIERSVAYNNGSLNTAAEGPVGIWTYDSDSVVIQHNESYRNRTNGTADGGGFDLDQNTRNSTLQYNYSHDNDGPGYLLAHAPNNMNHTGNVVRYNITQNDGRRNGASAIVIWGRTIGAAIYNNSVYLKPSTSGTSRAVHIHNATVPANDVKNVHFRNNAFFADSGATTLLVTAGQLTGAIDLRFEGNNYFGRTAPPKFIWGSSTYVGIGAWRNATGQELLGGAPTGSVVDPRFTAAGGGGTIGNADLLASLTAYTLKSTSLLINKGLNLQQQFGMDAGPFDFYSGALPFGSGYDVGAHEWR
ncbi:MAG: right-handed parallel beta-helix repeat-containing protein [Gemmatimonadaceae bacterium]